jgi:hypothetical protein
MGIPQDGQAKLEQSCLMTVHQFTVEFLIAFKDSVDQFLFFDDCPPGGIITQV